MVTLIIINKMIVLLLYKLLIKLLNNLEKL